VDDGGFGEHRGVGGLDTRMTTQVLSRARERLANRSRLVEIVATPGSGNGRGMATAVRLREALRARGHDVQLEVFAGLESLRRWAATDATRFSFLICVGGDATQSTAAMAAVRRSVPFLPVPAGFGNLFARAFGHPNRVDRVVDLVDRGTLVHSDVGIQNGELFLCHASFGLLSEVQDRVEASAYPRARWRRWVAYYRVALRHLRDTPLAALQVTVDGRVVTQDAAVVTVANVETYGGWLRLTPAASPVDGLFDVFVMQGATKREILAKLLRRYFRLPGASSGARLYRGRRVSVAASRSARNELELIPGVLPVLVSPERAMALNRLLIPADVNGSRLTGAMTA
jgi:diacylglycerol kinase (ATP)